MIRFFKNKIKNKFKLEDPFKNTLMANWHFQFMPYSLGDTITWQVNSQIAAIKAGYKNIAHVLCLNPHAPGSIRLQPFVTRENYGEHISNIFPAFLCNPMMSSISIMRDTSDINNLHLSKYFSDNALWPEIGDKKYDFSTHNHINAFFSEHGYIPQLCAPKPFQKETENFINQLKKDYFVVCINIRQRYWSQIDWAAPHRDSPRSGWHEFFAQVQHTHPHVKFVILGGYSEWDRTLRTYPNIVVMRDLGFHLGHELGALVTCDMFMGTSSGFSAMATFCRTPYVITNFEKVAASYIGFPEGTKSYPFAAPNQILDWRLETKEIINDLFLEVYDEIMKSRGNSK